MAVLAPIAVVLVTKGIQLLLEPTLNPAFSVAVAIAALFGGWGPGAIASVLSTVGFTFFPHLLAGPDGVVRIIQFLVIATVITWIGGLAYRHRWLAVGQADENARLRGVAERAAREAEEAATRAEQAMSVAEEEAVNAEEAMHETAVALKAQQDAERSLRESEAALTDFFDTASTGLHWVGEDGTILRVNKAELELLGYTRDEYVGHHIAEFHVDGPVIEDILRRLRAGERLNRYPARMRCKDGRVHRRVHRLQRLFRGRALHSYPLLHPRRHPRETAARVHRPLHARSWPPRATPSSPRRSTAWSPAGTRRRSGSSGTARTR